MTTPPLAIDTPYGRIYQHPITMERLPSITTIIKYGVGAPELNAWHAKRAAEYADRNWFELSSLPSAERINLMRAAPEEEANTKAELGTAVHEAVDAICKGEPIPEIWPRRIAGHMRQFAEFVAVREPLFLYSEVTVFNRTVGYAGTLDIGALLGGRLTLLDNKTGENERAEAGLQLAALANGETIVHPDGWEEPFHAPEETGLLRLRPRSWALIPVRQREECWLAFCAARQIYDWAVNVAPDVLGPRLREVVA